MSSIRRLCVFCGSNSGNNPAYQEDAIKLGKLMAEKGIELVYGGGSIGIMGIIADTVMQAGGRVTGIIPQALMDAEIGHQAVTQLEVVDNMHTRKARMAELSDAFVALPGGIGTFEEFYEVWTWRQLRYHHKPVALLNTQNFYTPMLEFLNHCQSEGFIKPHNLKLIRVTQTPEALLEAILAQPSDASMQNKYF